jgi:hypothetical protein
VEQRIEDYKKANPGIFSWEIRDRLIKVWRLVLLVGIISMEGPSKMYKILAGNLESNKLLHRLRWSCGYELVARW